MFRLSLAAAEPAATCLAGKPRIIRAVEVCLGAIPQLVWRESTSPALAANSGLKQTGGGLFGSSTSPKSGGGFGFGRGTANNTGGAVGAFGSSTSPNTGGGFGFRQYKTTIHFQYIACNVVES